MNLLILSSVNPKISHEGAAQKVLAALMENIVKLGHKVSWATVLADKPLEEETRKYLKSLEIDYVGDFSNDVKAESRRNKFFHNLRAIRKCLIPFPNNDFPRFYKPEETFKNLKANNPDAFLLFWDTWFENLLPYMKGWPTVAYWAKPRYAAPMARLQSGWGGNKIKRWFLYKLCQHQRSRHLKRAEYLVRLSNICALDVVEYNANNIPCQYISNTWFDVFGDSWQEKRMIAEKSHSRFGILANVSSVSATGNTYGLMFLADKVLPYLDSCLSGIDWEINICGGGKFLSDVADHLNSKLKHPRVNIKGFVPDIDNEMLSNKVFLLLNNASIYSGGYTRAIYAFSSGSCLVAHRRLADSMPEIKNNFNALLGETGQEIANLVAKVAKDEALREKLSENGRLTYEREYHPKVVAKKLVDLAKSALSTSPSHPSMHRQV